MESFMFLVFKSIFKSGDKLTLGALCPPHLTLSSKSPHLNGVRMETAQWSPDPGQRLMRTDHNGLRSFTQSQSRAPLPEKH